jgi:Tol biopolymer transport system component
VRLLGPAGIHIVWSPDSRHLAIDGVGSAYEDELVIADRTTAGERRVVTAPQVLGFDFSPDGKRLVFALSTDELRSDIYVCLATGGSFRRLTWDNRSSYPLWGPDGSIVFSHQDGPLGAGAARDPFWGKHRLWRIRPNGTHRTVLTRRLKPALVTERLGLMAVASSRSGRLLVVSPTHNGDYVYVVSRTGSIRSLGDHGYFGYAKALDISRDGRFVLIWDQLGGPDSPRTRVELVPTDGGSARTLARNVGAPSWSR